MYLIICILGSNCVNTCLHVLHFIWILYLPQGYLIRPARITVHFVVLGSSQGHNTIKINYSVFVLFAVQWTVKIGTKLLTSAFINSLTDIPFVPNTVLVLFFFLPVRMLMAYVILQEKVTNRLLPIWLWIPASDMWIFCITISVEAYSQTSYKAGWSPVL